jgi:hypothetical protein
MASHSTSSWPEIPDVPVSLSGSANEAHKLSESVMKALSFCRWIQARSVAMAVTLALSTSIAVADPTPTVSPSRRPAASVVTPAQPGEQAGIIVIGGKTVRAPAATPTDPSTASGIIVIGGRPVRVTPTPAAAPR